MSKKKGIEGGFKGLMLRHMEKAIFAVVIVIFLLSIVKAVSHQKVDATPEQISQAAQTAETAVKNADQNYEPPAAQEIITEVAKADVAVDFIPYELQRTPVPGQSTGNLQKRGTPQVFAVRDLQTTPGNGAILVQREEEEFDPNATTSTMQVANNNQRGGMGGGMGGGMSGGMSGDMGMGGGMSGGMDMMSGGMSGGPGMMGGGMSGGSGMGMGGSMSEPKIVNWICVTGVIDFQKQMDEYNRCFEEAVQRYPERDMYPVYSYFTIERAEVDASNPTAEPKWEAIDLAKAFEPLFLEWSGFSMEAADASMTTLGLPFVYPLPVLSGGKWGEEVAHLPEIPLMDFTSRQYTMGGFGMQQQTTTVRNAKGKKTEETKAVFDPKAIYTKLMQNQDLLRKSGRTSGMGGMGGMGGGYGSSMMSGGMSGGYGGGMGSGMSGGSGMGGVNNPLVSGIRNLTSMGRNAGRGGMSGGYGGGMGSGMGSGMMSGSMMGARGMYANAEYQLFRFFDFQVKPGTNYTYRVRLELENPNYKIPVDYLEDDKSGQDEYLLSAWSNDTGGTKVVGDSQILLGMTDSEAKENPKVPTLILVKMDEDTGKPQLHRVQPRVGQVLNLKDAEIVETQQQGRYASMMGSGPGMSGPGMSSGPGGRNARTTAKREKPKTTNFVSERLFVGANMGPKLSTNKGEHYGPAEVLLMDPDGRLVCLREDDDEAEYLRHFPKGRTIIPEPNKQKPQTGRGGPGMGGPGMMSGPSSM